MNIKQGLVFFFLAAAVTACGGSSSGGGGGGGTTTPTNPAVNNTISALTLRVSSDAATLGDLEVVDPSTNAVLRTLDLNLNGAVLVTADDTLITTQQTGVNGGKVVMFSNISTRTNAFSSATDGELFVSGLVSAAALDYDSQSGTIFIANDRNAQSMDGNVLAVARTATGPDSANAATPVFSSATLGGQPVGLVHDRATDVLYVVDTFARLNIFRNFSTLAGMTNVSPTQTVSLRDTAGNFLGFPTSAIFDLARNVFYVADAGTPNLTNDSSVQRFSVTGLNNSTTDLNGSSITTGASIDEDYGPMSLERANDHLLVGDTFEKRALIIDGASTANPVVTALAGTNLCFSDLVDNEEAVDAQNTPGTRDVTIVVDDPTNGTTIDSADSGLSGTRNTPTTVNDLSGNMTTTPVDADRTNGGVIYTAFKQGQSGGVSISGSAGQASGNSQSSRLTDPSQSSTRQEREISGVATSIDCPLAVSASIDKNNIFVLDENSNNSLEVLVFNGSSQGNSAPRFAVSIPSNVQPIDIAYSDKNDSIYILGRDQNNAAKIFVFDDVCQRTTNTTISRTICISDSNGNALISNPTSIAVDRLNGDTVFVADSGNTSGSTDDGQITVFVDDGNVNGNVTPQTILTGDLINPSNISVDESLNAYVVDDGMTRRIPRSQTLFPGTVTDTGPRNTLSVPNVIRITP